MGPINALGLRGTAFYYASVQFFLHFQLLLWVKLGFLPNYHLLLALTSVLMPLGLLVVLIDFKRENNT